MQSTGIIVIVDVLKIPRDRCHRLVEVEIIIFLAKSEEERVCLAFHRA
jgi:hypothetical protein